MNPTIPITLSSSPKARRPQFPNLSARHNIAGISNTTGAVTSLAPISTRAFVIFAVVITVITATAALAFTFTLRLIRVAIRRREEILTWLGTFLRSCLCSSLGLGLTCDFALDAFEREAGG